MSAPSSLLSPALETTAAVQNVCGVVVPLKDEPLVSPPGLGPRGGRTWIHRALLLFSSYCAVGPPMQETASEYQVVSSVFVWPLNPSSTLQEGFK